MRFPFFVLPLSSLSCYAHFMAKMIISNGNKRRKKHLHTENKMERRKIMLSVESLFCSFWCCLFQFLPWILDIFSSAYWFFIRYKGGGKSGTRGKHIHITHIFHTLCSPSTHNRLRRPTLDAKKREHSSFWKRQTHSTKLNTRNIHCSTSQSIEPWKRKLKYPSCLHKNFHIFSFDNPRFSQAGLILINLLIKFRTLNHKLSVFNSQHVASSSKLRYSQGQQFLLHRM